MEGIQLTVKQTGINNDISIIKVGGYIDTTTSAELEHSLDTLISANNYNIIIDLGNVDYISSAGWGIFISELKGIRDKSGDLKLVNMMPDVYEVFELLEFHYILKAFDSIDDAIADFDKKKGYVEEKAYSENTEYSPQPIEKPRVEHKQQQEEYVSKAAKPTKARLTVEDKIKKIILENPEIGSIKLLKTLNTPQYGYVKLGYLQLLKYLKNLNLNSKKKRLTFFQQMRAR